LENNECNVSDLFLGEKKHEYSLEREKIGKIKERFIKNEREFSNFDNVGCYFTRRD